MDGKLIDLSHAISAGMTRYPLQPDVEIEVLGSRLRAHVLHVGSHVGTHIDAPVHAIDGGRRMADLPLERFWGTAVVSSVSRGPGEVITLQDVLDGGPAAEPGEALLLHTGWDEHFADAEAYEDHPWLHQDVADWAVERRLTMVGVDMFSPDQPIDRREDNANFQYPVHRTLLGNDVLITENLTNLGEVGGQRGRFYAFPVLTAFPGGDAGHTRFVWQPLDS
ncbi:cyclase family protein [Geodermatophilus sabuli]|uniref:Cyclase family protein n=1 Tax=Geodermatophilus sabuli TaxID=1564158 RepID=A0A7K3W2U6_9ACTN|nr:cyclase family protein [Geodermatophilus sabuli]NEK58247.1 cyclase family protein [Geodermatophilus sabuli]